MPFKSKSQQRFLFSQHPDIAKRWAKETPNIKKLPEHVMNKKTVLKKAVGKYGKGGPGTTPTPSMATPPPLLNRIGNGIRNFLINNPIGKASSAVTSAFMDKMQQNEDNNAIINRAAQRGFNVPNQYLKDRNAGK